MKTLLMVMALVLSFNVIAEENLASDCPLTRDDINTRHNPKENLESVVKRPVSSSKEATKQ